MEPKIILAPFSGSDLELAALETAFHLAKEWKAHVAVWQVLPNPEEMVGAIAAFGMGAQYLPDETTFVKLLKINKKNEKEAKSKFLKLAEKMNIVLTNDFSDVKEASASLHVTIGNAEKIIPVRGRLTDLIVVTRNSGETLQYEELVNAVLFQTGRPVLLVPPGKTAKPLKDNTIIAWNGSKEAVHAVSGAFPFLKRGKVWAMTGESDHWDGPPLLPQELVVYLKRHDIEAEALMPWINSTPLPKVLHESVKKLDAGLIVMGAYGHSRMKEMIFGGVTEHMLKHATVPVLMVH